MKFLCLSQKSAKENGLKICHKNTQIHKHTHSCSCGRGTKFCCCCCLVFNEQNKRQTDMLYSLQSARDRLRLSLSLRFRFSRSLGLRESLPSSWQWTRRARKQGSWSAIIAFELSREWERESGDWGQWRAGTAAESLQSLEPNCRATRTWSQSTYEKMSVCYLTSLTTDRIGVGADADAGAAPLSVRL